MALGTILKPLAPRAKMAAMDHATLKTALKDEPSPTSALLVLVEETFATPALLAAPAWDELAAMVLRNGSISGDFRADEDATRLIRTLRAACAAHLEAGDRAAAEPLWRLLLRGLAAPPRPLRP